MYVVLYSIHCFPVEGCSRFGCRKLNLINYLLKERLFFIHYLFALLKGHANIFFPTECDLRLFKQFLKKVHDIEGKLEAIEPER